jgi:hypothetical protein
MATNRESCLPVIFGSLQPGKWSALCLVVSPSGPCQRVISRIGSIERCARSNLTARDPDQESSMQSRTLGTMPVLESGHVGPPIVGLTSPS